MKKILIGLAAVAMLFFSRQLHAGHGPYADEQPGLIEKMESWKRGDEIPPYLFIDDGDFNPMSQHTPGYYISLTKNSSLLINLTLHLDTSGINADMALNRVIEIEGMTKLAKMFKEIQKENSHKLNLDRVNYLRRILSDKCLTVYYIYINYEDMTKKEASDILTSALSRLNNGESVQTVYKDLYKKFPGSDLKPGDVIGNGGAFHLSSATGGVVPASYERKREHKQNMQKLLRLEKGQSVLLEEKRNKEDVELIKAHGEIIYTETDDRLMLYSVIDFYRPNKP